MAMNHLYKVIKLYQSTREPDNATVALMKALARTYTCQSMEATTNKKRYDTNY